jgi:hypothetical protein
MMNGILGQMRHQPPRGPQERLAYVNPQEEGILSQLGGSGAMTQDGVPSYSPWGGGNDPMGRGGTGFGNASDRSPNGMGGTTSSGDARGGGGMGGMNGNYNTGYRSRQNAPRQVFTPAGTTIPAAPPRTSYPGYQYGNPPYGYHPQYRNVNWNDRMVRYQDAMRDWHAQARAENRPNAFRSGGLTRGIGGDLGGNPSYGPSWGGKYADRVGNTRDDRQ